MIFFRHPIESNQVCKRTLVMISTVAMLLESAEDVSTSSNVDRPDTFRRIFAEDVYATNGIILFSILVILGIKSTML